jgi:predicted nucleic acid-binding protein
MLVIADTTPLNYLILIDAIEFLPRLYRQVILPRGAWQELQHTATPPAVVHWARTLPNWIEVRDAPASTDPSLEALGKGEREAIALAELYRHESGVLLLLDEQAARQQAATRRIAATGTLGVLKAASAEG